MDWTMNGGAPLIVIVRTSAASASVAVAVTGVIAVPSDPVAVAGAEIAGVWFVFAIVSTVVELAVALVAPEPSLTVNTMLYDPASVNVGVPVIVAVRGEGPAACAVNVNDAGFPSSVVDTSELPSPYDVVCRLLLDKMI